MNISCDLDKHYLKKSKDTSNRRNSLPEYTAFEQKKGKNYNAFNTKTKKTIKLLSKSNDGMIECITYLYVCTTLAFILRYLANNYRNFR